jgi:CRP-like cAMP-binding protein
MAPSSAVAKPGTTSRQDCDAHPVFNDILRILPPKEFNQLVPNLEYVRLKSHQVLHEAGETLKSAYFCNSGLFSVMTIMPDGKSVEVGLVGKEGMSGVPLIAGFYTSHTRTVVQVEGTAFRIDARQFKMAIRQLPNLESQAQRYGQLAALQVMQTAACNQLHEVEERLARWLLMSHDRLGSNRLPLTHDFLAQMLGTRRSTVSISACILQRAGVIEHLRGETKIVNRRGLEQEACECYEQLKRQMKEWQAQTTDLVR